MKQGDLFERPPPTQDFASLALARWEREAAVVMAEKNWPRMMRYGKRLVLNPRLADEVVRRLFGFGVGKESLANG
jgi:hypothetical protein